ncbi:mucin-3B-like isoform X2 [Hyperolius riggenbachi]|uniref:mucin-3B-like isoform X2 n=1 Tax=Hyperolius riggenbachi TaxID=752182 RepID=UPI0035A2AC40
MILQCRVCRAMHILFLCLGLLTGVSQILLVEAADVTTHSPVTVPATVRPHDDHQNPTKSAPTHAYQSTDHSTHHPTANAATTALPSIKTTESHHGSSDKSTFKSPLVTPKEEHHGTERPSDKSTHKSPLVTSEEETTSKQHSSSSSPTSGFTTSGAVTEKDSTGAIIGCFVFLFIVIILICLVLILRKKKKMSYSLAFKDSNIPLTNLKV